MSVLSDLLIVILQMEQPPVTTEIIIAIMIEGAIGATVLSILAFLLSRFTKEIIGRSLLAIFLFAAAGAYFGFIAGAVSMTSPIWMLIELSHIVVFGTMALFGLRSNSNAPYWIAAGWALHPLWDAWHLIGPGSSFTPVFYAIACFSFDLLVAVFIVIVYRLELVGNPRSALLE